VPKAINCTINFEIYDEIISDDIPIHKIECFKFNSSCNDTTIIIKNNELELDFTKLSILDTGKNYTIYAYVEKEKELDAYNKEWIEFTINIAFPGKN
jgi:hypothetical protein